MSKKLAYQTYGFRFNSYANLHLPLCHLFAVGYDSISDGMYRWNGLERNDGPLLLFQYTLQGNGIFETDFHSTQVGASQAFLAEIPSEHCYYYEKQPQKWEFFFILIRPHTVLPLWNEIVQWLGRTPDLPRNSKPIQCLENLIRAAQNGEIQDAYTASEYVYSFIIELHKYSRHVPHITTPPKRIQEAVAFIDEHYNNMINQEELAHMLGLSKYQFIRNFSKYMGLTPNDYLNRKKIENSLTLLLSSELSLEEIAAKVGYSSASYYIRVFRKLIGQTPATFRNNKEQQQIDKLYFD